MNTKNNSEATTEQAQISDLTISEEHAAEVKGGPSRGDGGGGDIVVFDIVDANP